MASCDLPSSSSASSLPITSSCIVSTFIEVFHAISNDVITKCDFNICGGDFNICGGHFHMITIPPPPSPIKRLIDGSV